MAKTTLARGDSGGTENSESSSQTELFPKRNRRVGKFKTTVAHLEAQLADMPKLEYVATENDIPVIFWKEPSFD